MMKNCTPKRNSLANKAREKENRTTKIGSIPGPKEEKKALKKQTTRSLASLCSKTPKFLRS